MEPNKPDDLADDRGGAKWFWLAVVFVLGGAVGWLLREPDELPDMMGEVQVVRLPGGDPDAPAPAGGRFRVVIVTEDGSKQRFRQPRENPQWGFSLAGGRVYLHAVRISE